jgi:hypothetical protein
MGLREALYTKLRGWEGCVYRGPLETILHPAAFFIEVSFYGSRGCNPSGSGETRLSERAGLSHQERTQRTARTSRTAKRNKDD